MRTWMNSRLASMSNLDSIFPRPTMMMMALSLSGVRVQHSQLGRLIPWWVLLFFLVSTHTHIY